MDFEEALDFTNFRNHPSDRSYVVFHYSKKPQADYFEHMLVESKFFFERHEEVRSGKGTTYYFAVKRVNLDAISHLNNLAIGRYRKRFIPDNIMRWVVIVISAIAVGLAVVGYLKS